MNSHGPLDKWWALIKSAVAAWIEDYAPSMGAALSYYTVFSLPPLLLIVCGGQCVHRRWRTLGPGDAPTGSCAAM